MCAYGQGMAGGQPYVGSSQDNMAVIRSGDTVALAVDKTNPNATPEERKKIGASRNAALDKANPGRTALTAAPATQDATQAARPTSAGLRLGTPTVLGA